MADEAMADRYTTEDSGNFGLRSSIFGRKGLRSAACGQKEKMVGRLAMFALVALLSACGGGGDHVGIGSGQSADPVVTDFPIFYVKRSVPTTAATDDLTRKRRFLIGADLYMRERASVSATETNITASLQNCDNRDIKDVDVSADAQNVIFAMRCVMSANQKDEDPPTWGIWEYNIRAKDLHRVIQSDVTAADGEDISPHYLPDGRIVFSSTRQHESKAVQVFEGGSQFEAQTEARQESAFVLHVMDGVTGSPGAWLHDDSSIHQVSFNQSHDSDTTVLADGRILFTRWDRANGKNGMHLYTANPDGTDMELLYGAESHNTGSNNSTIQFTRAREMQNGNILALVRPFTYNLMNGAEPVFGGDLFIIDTKTYIENNQALAANAGLVGPAQIKALPNDIRTVAGPSPGGRFNSAVPLWDGTNRILTGWTQCRMLDLQNGNAIVPCTSDRIDAYNADVASQTATPRYADAPPLYSVWMFDPSDQTLKPVVPPTEGIMIYDVTAAQPRPVPLFRQSKVDQNPGNDKTLANEGVGILDIRSVYDLDGTQYNGITSIATVADPTNPSYAQRPARFLRIEKAVSLPSRDVRDIDNSAFGVSNFMRQIIGYVPIEPDGSVRVKVPADVALQISVLDANARRIQNFSRHNVWLQVRPGETAQCNGCHMPTPANGTTSGRSHGRQGAFNALYAGATTGGQTFANANATFVSGTAGDTMAESRAVWSCANEQCRAITPKADVVYSDVWPAASDPHTVDNPGMLLRPADFAYPYTGSNGLKTTPPLKNSSTCLPAWTSTCRIVINYLTHIQPVWELSRPDPVLVDPMTMQPVDHKCTGCHVPTANNAVAVPAGQLDLSNSPSTDPNAGVRITSYQQLLVTHNAQELNATMTALQDHCLQFQTDPVTNVTTCAQFDTVSPALAALNARGSRFFTVMENAPGQRATVPNFTPVDHRGFMSSGELRLIAEWVDIGAQYYNDPFLAPVN